MYLATYEQSKDKDIAPSTLHHSPAQYAQDLIDDWSDQLQANNLPVHIQ